MTKVIPSVAAGVIIETPPGGRRGSIAFVVVAFLLPEPPVTVALLFTVPVTELDPEAELEPDAVLDALSSSSLLLLELADAETDADWEAVCDAEVDCAGSVLVPIRSSFFGSFGLTLR